MSEVLGVSSSNSATDIENQIVEDSSSEVVREILDENGSIIRLNLIFQIDTISPFPYSDMITVPDPLLKRGVTFDEWKKWTHALLKINQDRLSLSLLDKVFHKEPRSPRESNSKIDKWNTQLLSWQDDFNNQVLIGKGIFVKSKSYSWLEDGKECQVTTGEDGVATTNVNYVKGKRFYDRRFIFSLNETEQELLMFDDHLGGVVYMNECSYCMHP